MPVNSLSLQDLTGRELPYSLEAEQTVLGALLINPEVLPLVISRLKPDCFYREQHRQIYSVILRMFSNGQEADIITVMNEVVSAGIFETPEMAKAYLKGVMDGVPSTSNILSYCKIVEDKYLTRALMSSSRDILEACSDGSEDPKTLLDLAEQKIYEIRQGREVEGLTRLSEVLVGAYDRIQKLSGEDKDSYQGLKTGFGQLDSYISGLNRSDLIIVAGRPGMGKSAFAFNIAVNVGRRNPDKDVCIFSLEMSKEQIATRMLSSEALVPNTALNSGEITSDQWVKLAAAADLLTHMNIYIDDTAGITVPQMKAKLRRMRNLGLVIIDYLQLMESSSSHTNRVNEISEITRQLKLMAKELDVPVILASQLNRSVESRQDHRPMPSDLRESGSIEQDADIILFVYRESAYNKELENQSSAECIIGKNRHGSTGTVNMAFLGEYTLFRNLDTRQQV